MKAIDETTHGQSGGPILIFPVDRVNIRRNGMALVGNFIAIRYDDNKSRLRSLFTFLKANSFEREWFRSREGVFDYLNGLAKTPPST